MLGIAFGFVYTWIEDGSSDSRFSKPVAGGYARIFDHTYIFSKLVDFFEKT
jgi:hypothetical protein